jgi:nucleotide-binding universal stress UspA family protein
VAEYTKVTPIDHIRDALRTRFKERAKGDPRQSIATVPGKARVAIPDLPEETDADLIIRNSPRPAAHDCFVGGTAARVVRRSHCAALVLR